MAGDWIKVETATVDKPEIFQIADMLDMDPDEAFGKCVRFWIWADQQSRNGHALNVTKKYLDRVCHRDGFTDALEKVGWLQRDGDTFDVPNFDRHNGKTAKQRALATKRKQNERSKCHDASVTKTRPEKRREEKEKINKKKVSFVPPSVSEVQGYIQEYSKKKAGWPVRPFDADSFVDHYESNGWMVGRNKMKDWKATVRKWGSRSFDSGKQTTDKPLEYVQ